MSVFCHLWLLHAVSFTIYVKSMVTVLMTIGYRKKTGMNLLLHRLLLQYKLHLLVQWLLEMHFVTILISKLIKTAEVLTMDVLVIIRSKSDNKMACM